MNQPEQGRGSPGDRDDPEIEDARDFAPRFLIVGAGGFGREVACWLAQYGTLERPVTDYPAARQFVAYFLDDRAPLGRIRAHRGAHALSLEDYPPVLCSIDGWRPRDSDRLVVAIGDPEERADAVERLEARMLGTGARFGVMIHSRATIAPSASIAPGAIICPNAVVSADARLGRHVIVNVGTSIGHDVEVGDFTTFSSQCDITGGVKIGPKCFFGSRAGALPGVRIGELCNVGAGAIAVRNVAAFGTLFENPPRFLSAEVTKRGGGASSGHDPECAIWTTGRFGCTCGRGTSS